MACRSLSKRRWGRGGGIFLLQFLSEAMVITGLGGGCGIVLAYLVSALVGRIPFGSAFMTNGEAADIRLLISWQSVAASVVILGVVGLVSGMIPAMRASRLDPIEALRQYE